jgi:hypothetical protein
MASDEDLALPETLEGALLAFDDRGRGVVLFTDEWAMRIFIQRNSTLELSPVPVGTRPPVAAGPSED